MTDPLHPSLDPETLREVDVDVPAVTARADSLAAASDAPALAARADALRLLDRLDEAERCARGAVAAAEATDDSRQVARARLALGQVLRRRSRFAEAEAEFAVVLADAAQVHDEQLRALALEQRGRSRFDQGRVEEAERDFTAALQVNRRLEPPAAHVADLEVAVTAAMRRLMAAGRS